MTKTIFLDMDGVLFDFDAIMKPFKLRPQQLFPKLAAEPQLFETFPLMPNALTLVDFLQRAAASLEFNLRILSRAPSSAAIIHKQNALAKHFPTLLDSALIFTRQSKADFRVTLDCILIDDQFKNLEAWRPSPCILYRNLESVTSFFMKPPYNFHVSMQDLCHPTSNLSQT